MSDSDLFPDSRNYTETTWTIYFLILFSREARLFAKGPGQQPPDRRQLGQRAPGEGRGQGLEAPLLSQALGEE